MKVGNKLEGLNSLARGIAKVPLTLSIQRVVLMVGQVLHDGHPVLAVKKAECEMLI